MVVALYSHKLYVSDQDDIAFFSLINPFRMFVQGIQPCIALYLKEGPYTELILYPKQNAFESKFFGADSSESAARRFGGTNDVGNEK